MKKIASKIIIKTSKYITPLVMALAIMTVNSTCYFFTHQPDIPRSLDKYKIN